MSRRTARVIALLLAGSAAACGNGGSSDGDGGPPDALVPDGGVDGGDAGELACTVDETVGLLPEELSGTLNGASADYDLSDQTCETAVAPFGVAALGPDRVFRASGLEPGTDYAVRLVSAEDLAFYVASGCSGGDAPEVSGCLLYVDGSTDGLEVGRFTAPDSGEALVVVDHWEAEAPADGSFTMEIYRVECDGSDASACAGTTPVCVDYRCASCDTSFDCSSPGAPVCDPIDDRCTVGVDQCDADDAGEPDDDGPAGARDITSTGAPSSLAGKICNRPGSEYDFYRFDVDANGGAYTVELDWSPASVDLDMEILDAGGMPFGLSLFENPEVVELTYLEAGRYYVRVNYAASQQISAAVDYTITATRGPTTGCTGVADCATEYRNQYFRSICTAGACTYRLGDGSLAEGAVCDTSPDCSSGECASFPFTANADTRSVCTLPCSDDADCAPMGSDYVCSTYLADNKCVQTCTTDEQCPVSLSFLPQSGPWYRLTCNTSTGKCSF